MSAAGVYDFIIVGAGSAGCVVANRLVRQTDSRVLLIEAGGPDSRPEIHQERLSATLALWTGGELDWGYVTESQRGLHDRAISVARGKVWGGCSSINAMLHVRGSRLDYDRWAALGNAGWGYEDVLPFFRESEDFEGGPSHYRGVGGPISVIYHADPTPVSKQLFAAGTEIGLRDRGGRFDYNGAEQEEIVFYYQTTKTREHTRASAAVAYLYPILGAPNFTLRDRATATRLICRAGHVTGVEYVVDGRVEQVQAEQEVILSCGAFGSPHLLMLSGIGPAPELTAHGIGVVADLPGVGQNLQDHMILGVGYLARQEHPFEPTLIAETGFFTRSQASDKEEPPDLQMLFGGVKFVSPRYDREGPGFTFAPVIVQPRSVGSLTLRSASPHDAPVLQPNYLTHGDDIATFITGIEMARALAGTSALADFVKTEIAPGPGVTRRADLVEFIRENAGTLWHPVGTCRMGDDDMAVVDARLRVHGVEGLRVADAAIMPRIVAGNTNAACIMIGEKASSLVLAAHHAVPPERGTDPP